LHDAANQLQRSQTASKSELKLNLKKVKLEENFASLLQFIRVSIPI